MVKIYINFIPCLVRRIYDFINVLYLFYGFFFMIKVWICGSSIFSFSFTYSGFFFVLFFCYVF